MLVLKKQPVDRIPIFMWFHPEIVEILSNLLDILKKYVGIAMRNDINQTWVNNNSGTGLNWNIIKRFILQQDKHQMNDHAWPDCSPSTVPGRTRLWLRRLWAHTQNALVSRSYRSDSEHTLFTSLHLLIFPSGSCLPVITLPSG